MKTASMLLALLLIAPLTAEPEWTLEESKFEGIVHLRSQDESVFVNAAQIVSVRVYTLSPEEGHRLVISTTQASSSQEVNGYSTKAKIYWLAFPSRDAADKAAMNILAAIARPNKSS